MNKTVYKIKNRISGLYYSGFRFTVGEPKVYKTERAAREAIRTSVLPSISVTTGITSSRWANNFKVDTVSKFKAASSLFDIVIEEHEIVTTCKGLTAFSYDDQIRNLMIGNKLYNEDYKFRDFWRIASAKGYANDIKYLVTFDVPAGMSLDKATKAARAKLRLLGVKTRTFREHRGVFGFYNEEQAMNAKWSMDVDKILKMADIIDSVK